MWPFLHTASELRGFKAIYRNYHLRSQNFCNTISEVVLSCFNGERILLTDRKTGGIVMNYVSTQSRCTSPLVVPFHLHSPGVSRHWTRHLWGYSSLLGPCLGEWALHSSRDGDSTACQEHLLQFWADLTVKSIFSLHLIKMSMLLLRPLPREEFRYHPLCEHPGKESS